ncbi:hypothetical protein V2K91_21410 [Pseudomonas alliivorans]|nr:hypothetical protein [Pseudomonas alliivorans]
MISNDFYVSRKAITDDKVFDEVTLLNTSNFIVVLSEPGGGKTEFLKSLASKLKTIPVSANFFSHMGMCSEGPSLVIDAFDELSKIDEAGIHKLLALAKKANPTRLIISSRSSEWDNSLTHVFQEFIGHKPLVVRLRDLEESEQCLIFSNYVTDEDFLEFRNEVKRFDLEKLLPNPQFLKMFADAYIASNRNFANKRSIFSQAIDSLAKEANPSISKNKDNISSIGHKVTLASQVFAKILLSGSEGITTSELNENRMYPLLNSLYKENSPFPDILATRLFKPGSLPDQHIPIHKVIAEYCAAEYLTRRIADVSDSLSLSKCLPLIAPNFVVRDELRGLIGWMASLGNRLIEESLIHLDPYAVLANGDPTQLSPPSKRYLIQRLKETERLDPYFRRGDFWRRFSVAGFFSQDVIDEIRPILKSANSGHLRNLILELLKGSKAAELLSSDLHAILTAAHEDDHTRYLASMCLIEIPEPSYIDSLKLLISEATEVALKISGDLLKKSPTKDLNIFIDFFIACSRLYPKLPTSEIFKPQASFFIKKLVKSLPNIFLAQMLDALTITLECKCGASYYNCGCKTGMSKIIGMILDHHLESSITPLDPHKIWGWTKDLYFHEQISPNQSKAVEILRAEKSLRQQILSNVFSKLNDFDSIIGIKLTKFNHYSHAGLSLTLDDEIFLADLAFQKRNLSLWRSCLIQHNYHFKTTNPTNELRMHLRKQAMAEPSFMIEWYRFNKLSKQSENLSLYNRMKQKSVRTQNRILQKQNLRRERNITFVRENRKTIEAGEHIPCLANFARLTLMYPSRIEKECGDETTVRTILKNCIKYITHLIPVFTELGHNATRTPIIRIVLASCLELIRQKKSLAGVDVNILKTLRVCLNVYYNAVTHDEIAALKKEIDRIIFQTSQDIESFLRMFLEPHLMDEDFFASSASILFREHTFNTARRILCLEWLDIFQQLPIKTAELLFELAVDPHDCEPVTRIIEKQCNKALSKLACEQKTKAVKRTSFWYTRAFFFINPISDTQLNWLKTDKDFLNIFYSKVNPFRNMNQPSWPTLSAPKIEAILNLAPTQDSEYISATKVTQKITTDYSLRDSVTDLIWMLNSCDPEESLLVIERLMYSKRHKEHLDSLKSIYSAQLRKKALRTFEPPAPQKVVALLDHSRVVTVEGLRQLILDELFDYQKSLYGDEFNSVFLFYENGIRLGEVRSTSIISNHLNLRLSPLGITITPEHQLKNANRSDFTASMLINNKRKLLVTEVKGQWHQEIYTAAKAQLFDRYSIHPDAEQQGIYLALWFGKNEKIADRKNISINNSQELKAAIEASIPAQIKNFIDVFVLDVSIPGTKYY